MPATHCPQDKHREEPREEFCPYETKTPTLIDVLLAFLAGLVLAVVRWGDLWVVGQRYVCSC